MKYLKSILILFICAFALFATARTARASEGQVFLRSTTSENYHCYAYFELLTNSNYKMLVSCRDLVYPPHPDTFSYVIWTTPIDGGKPVRLGELGVGVAEFQTKDAFSSLFVTVEQDKGVRSPSGLTVMRGGVEQISFLENPTTPTPTPEGQPSPTQAQNQSTRDKLITGLKRAGLVSALAIIAIIGLVFVLTRPRS